MDFELPYASRRMPVLAPMSSATSQPLAAQAGLRMLLSAGTPLTLPWRRLSLSPSLEPTSNGIGSDAFAILWDGERCTASMPLAAALLP